jgi:hypothetical protein
MAGQQDQRRGRRSMTSAAQAAINNARRIHASGEDDANEKATAAMIVALRLINSEWDDTQLLAGAMRVVEQWEIEKESGN